MRVEVHLSSQSQPVVRDDVRTTYLKEGLFCVMHDDTRRVEKYPLDHIFRIIEISGDGER